MQIEYDNEEVRRIFNDFGIMQKSIGKDLTRSVKKKLDNLVAANTFAIYLQTGLGKPHSLEGDKKGMYGINVSASMRLIVKPVVNDLSSESLKKCDLIIIKGVEDYHGTKNEWIIP